jgi:hypothetical protein
MARPNRPTAHLLSNDRHAAARHVVAVLGRCPERELPPIPDQTLAGRADDDDRPTNDPRLSEGRNRRH